jgi:hypothetical protein
MPRRPSSRSRPHRLCLRSQRSWSPEVLPTRGDGSCLFRAIAYALTSDRRYADGSDPQTVRDVQDVRRELVRYVCANWSNDAPNQRPWGDNVAEYYGVRTVDAYERHMTDPRTWGGHIELTAAVVPFGGIHVHQPDGRADQRTGDAKLHVAYNGHDHYSAMRQPSRTTRFIPHV